MTWSQITPNIGHSQPQAQSVREVFARQLMQVRGLSGEKAAALVDRYSTPARYTPESHWVPVLPGWRSASPVLLEKLVSVWESWKVLSQRFPGRGRAGRMKGASITRIRKRAVSRFLHSRLNPACLSSHDAGPESQPLYALPPVSWLPMTPVPPRRSRRCC